MADGVVSSGKEGSETEVLLNDSSKRIPKKQQVAYGFGDMGNGFMFDLGQAYLTKFWIDGTGISAGIVGGIFAFTKIFDAIMDPIVGTVIDNREGGKHGKFRPVMMFSSVLLAIMTVVTFTMPMGLSDSQKVMYALITYMIWGVFYSMTNDPYGSLASVMSRNLEDRSFMSTTRQVGSVVAQLVAGVAFIPLMQFTSGGHPLHGYTIAAAIFGIMGVLGFLVCFLGTRENLKVKRDKTEKESMKDYFRVIFTNGPLGALILMTLFTISAMNTNNQMMVFYAQYNLGNIGLQPIINFIMMGSSVVGVFMVPSLTKHFGQKKTAVVSLFIGAIANTINYLLPTNLYTFIIFVTIGYVALAIPNGITWALVSNAIDYGEWHTGHRKEGITYAAFNFSRKIAQSIAALVSSGLLAVTGYIANHAQTEAALNGIKIAMTLYPAICLAAAGIIIWFLFRLDDTKFKNISDDLDHGRWENGTL